MMDRECDVGLSLIEGNVVLFRACRRGRSGLFQFACQNGVKVDPWQGQCIPHAGTVSMYCAVEEQTMEGAVLQQKDSFENSSHWKHRIQSHGSVCGAICALGRASNGRRFWSTGFAPGHHTKPEIEALVRKGTAANPITTPLASTSSLTQNEGQEPMVLVTRTSWVFCHCA
jgi:hypothetical protein